MEFFHYWKKQSKTENKDDLQKMKEISQKLHYKQR